MMLLLLLLHVISARIAPREANTLTGGVPFIMAPPCTIPFTQELFAFSFQGVGNVSLTGFFSAAQGWPGAPQGAHKLLCSEATLLVDGQELQLSLELAGPRASTSRVVNENHPETMLSLLTRKIDS